MLSKTPSCDGGGLESGDAVQVRPRTVWRRVARTSTFSLLGTLLLAGCLSAAQDVDLDADALLSDLAALASPGMDGRRTGTAGNARAREYLLRRLSEEGVPAAPDGYTHPFPVDPGPDQSPLEGVNVAAMLEGRARPDLWIVVSAHYDHLGIRGGALHPGADDNASGTAAVLHVAAHFARHPPEHSMLFLFTDAEEMGLRGAHAFVQDPLVPLDSIALIVNLDMVSRSEVGELYVAGTYHSPFLREPVEAVEPRPGVRLLFGHDRPDLPPGDDWTHASDHGPFHLAGIPFLYFGVEDHPGYHDPTDTFENVTPAFYVAAVETITDVIRSLDPLVPHVMDHREAAVPR